MGLLTVQKCELVNRPYFKLSEAFFFYGYVFKTRFFMSTITETRTLLHVIQKHFKGSNIFGTIEINLSYGLFESLQVNHNARSGSKMAMI